MRQSGATRVVTIVVLVVAAAIVVGVGYAMGVKSRRPAATPLEEAPCAPAPPAPAPRERTREPAPAPVPGALGADRAAVPGEAPVPPAAAPFRISPARIDLGNVSPGQPLSGSFTIRNVTERPLVLTSVEGDFSAQPRGGLDGSVIGPRGSLDVTVDLDYKTTMTGPRQLRVTVRFAEHDEPATVLLVAEVTRPVKASPAYLPATAQTSGELVVESIDGQAFRVLAVNGRPLEAASGGERSPRHTMAWDVSGYDATTCRDAQGNRMPEWWVVETDHPGAPIVDVLVRHRCTFPERPPTSWRPAERRVVLGVVDPAAPLEFVVPIVPMRGAAVGDDPITSVAAELPGATVELIGVSEEEEQSVCRLRLTLAPEHTGLLYGQVRLSSSSGHATVTIIGTVRK